MGGILINALLAKTCPAPARVAKELCIQATRLRPSLCAPLPQPPCSSRPLSHPWTPAAALQIPGCPADSCPPPPARQDTAAPAVLFRCARGCQEHATTCCCARPLLSCLPTLLILGTFPRQPPCPQPHLVTPTLTPIHPADLPAAVHASWTAVHAPRAAANPP